MSNLPTVQLIYEAFGKGDIPAILDVIAEDVEWEAWDDNSAVKAGVPWMVWSDQGGFGFERSDGSYVDAMLVALGLTPGTLSNPKITLSTAKPRVGDRITVKVSATRTGPVGACPETWFVSHTRGHGDRSRCHDGGRRP